MGPSQGPDFGVGCPAPLGGPLSFGPLIPRGARDLESRTEGLAEMGSLPGRPLRPGRSVGGQPLGTGCILPCVTKSELSPPPPCQVAQGAPGKQAFNRVAPSLEFAETVTPSSGWERAFFGGWVSGSPWGCAGWTQAHHTRALFPSPAVLPPVAPVPGPAGSRTQPGG